MIMGRMSANTATIVIVVCAAVIALIVLGWFT